MDWPIYDLGWSRFRDDHFYLSQNEPSSLGSCMLPIINPVQSPQSQFVHGWFSLLTASLGGLKMRIGQ